MPESIEHPNIPESEGTYNDVATLLSRIGEDGLEPTPANVVVNSIDDVTRHGISEADAARELGIPLSTITARSEQEQ